MVLNGENTSGPFATSLHQVTSPYRDASLTQLGQKGSSRNSVRRAIFPQDSTSGTLRKDLGMRAIWEIRHLPKYQYLSHWSPHSIAVSSLSPPETSSWVKKEKNFQIERNYHCLRVYTLLPHSRASLDRVPPFIRPLCLWFSCTTIHSQERGQEFLVAGNFPSLLLPFFPPWVGIPESRWVRVVLQKG